jgi:hypothetical protein
MALQNQRALYWRGEDLGYGGGNTRENTVTMTVPASSRPNLQTMVLRGTAAIPLLLSNPALTSILPNIRCVVNRSPLYYMTLIATCAPFGSGAAQTLVHLPIPPLQTLFLPNNIVMDANTQIVANSTFTVPVPVGNVASVLIATSTQALTFDVLQEN